MILQKEGKAMLYSWESEQYPVTDRAEGVDGSVEHLGNNFQVRLLSQDMCIFSIADNDKE